MCRFSDELGEERIKELKSIKLVNSVSHLPGLEFMPEPDYMQSTRWLTAFTIDESQLGISSEILLQLPIPG